MFHHHGCLGRRHHKSRPRRSCRARGSLGNHRAGRRPGDNSGWRGWGGDNNRRCGSWLRENLARFRAARCRGRSRRCGNGYNGRPRRCGKRWRCRCLGGPRRGQMSLPRLLLLALLVGQNSLHHVPRLGDVREVDFWRHTLLGACARGTPVASRLGPAIKMNANLFRLVILQRTGVGLAFGQAEFHQYVKNLTALDFHLAREIVDSNLTHPPLFENATQSPQSLIATSWQWLFLEIPWLPG